MANRREFMRTLSGVAALSITTDVSQLGRMRFLRMATAMPDTQPARPPATGLVPPQGRARSRRR